MGTARGQTRGNNDPAFPLARRRNLAYICARAPCFGAVKGGVMSDTGLQKLAFVLLLALILYVSITGGA